MDTPTIDPERDLELRRVIRAPRETVWRAWTDPELLERWWIPAPMVARVEELDARPGGAFVTRMSEDGAAFGPHVDGLFLDAQEGRRLVFTNGVDHTGRPAQPQPVAMTAEILLDDHPDGTDYRVVVRHGDPADRSRHEEIGFFDGWGTVTEQLAAVAEADAAS